jgi:hypothetical protein
MGWGAQSRGGSLFGGEGRLEIEAGPTALGPSA